VARRETQASPQTRPEPRTSSTSARRFSSIAGRLLLLKRVDCNETIRAGLIGTVDGCITCPFGIPGFTSSRDFIGYARKAKGEGHEKDHLGSVSLRAVVPGCIMGATGG